MSSGRKIEPGMAAAVSGTFVGSFPTDAGRDVRRVPQYAAPREVGCFSVVGEHRDFVNGRDELKYLCMPREPDALSWNLNKGLEDAVWANFDEPERLDRLLRWITENRREVTSDRDPQRNKLLSCWSQSFLTGVPRVMVGFRTAYGEVQSVQEYSVEEMPSLARGQWSDRVCLRFLDEMLSFVKECVTEDDPNAVYLFTFDPRQDPKVVCKKLSDPGEFQILSSSYLDALGH